MGNRSFLGRMAVTPSLTLVNSDTTSTIGLFRYSIADYLGQGALDNTVFDADGNNYAVGLFRQYRMIEENVQFLVGYQFDRNFSQGGNIDYNGHNVQAGMSWLLPFQDIQLNVLGQVNQRGYINPDAATLISRKDIEYVLQASLVYPLNDEWYATFSWLLDRNTSDLPTADYKRQVFELGVQYNFPQGNQLDPTLLRRRTTY